MRPHRPLGVEGRVEHRTRSTEREDLGPWPANEGLSPISGAGRTGAELITSLVRDVRDAFRTSVRRSHGHNHAS